jgi:hypothetical protein
MPWLDEFLEVIEQARRTAGPRAAAGLIEEDGAAKPGRMRPPGPGGNIRVSVEDPIAGSLQGSAEVGQFVDRSKAWLEERAGRVDRVAVTTSPSRTVAEFNVTVTERGRSAVLPLALVVEPTSAELRLRIYGSLWALTGQRIVRPPLLASNPEAHPAGIPGRYLRALRDGDAAACVACYEDDGCLQGPGGPASARCGRMTLAVEYPQHLERGGIVLEPCTVTANDERTALEFNIVRWGDVDLPPQAGISVYQMGRTGRILGNRVYDDVARPWG